MKNITWSVLFTIGFLAVAPPARAEKPVFETSTAIASGGPVGVSFLHTKFEPVRLPTALIAQRFSMPRYSNVSLQLELVPQSGYGASAVFNLAGSDTWKWNFIAGGYFSRWGKQMSVPGLPRRWDVTGGTSVEVLVHGNDGWLTVEYRAYAPNPGLVANMNSVYQRALMDAAKEGQLWLGYKRTW